MKNSSSLLFVALASLPLFSSGAAFAQQSAYDEDVRKNNTGYWGAGYFIGVPQKNSMKGTLHNTPEEEMGFGSFPSDQRYIGSSEEVSIDSEDLLAQIGKLKDDSHGNKSFVFRYVEYYPLNFVVYSHEHRTIVKQYYEMKSNFKDSKLPTEMSLNHDPGGNYSNGSRQGRIIDVERWGNGGHHVCTMTLESGGIKSGQSTDTNTLEMNLWSEQMCSYAEKLLFYGVMVDVTYKEEYFEIWSANSHNVTKIRVIEDGDTPAYTPAATSALESRIKLELLRDTGFTNPIKRQIMKEIEDKRAAKKQ